MVAAILSQRGSSLWEVVSKIIKKYFKLLHEMIVIFGAQIKSGQILFPLLWITGIRFEPLKQR